MNRSLLFGVICLLNVFASSAQSTNYEQIGLNYVVDSLIDMTTYYGQCGCPDRFDSTFKIVVLDSTDFPPDAEPYMHQMDVSYERISAFDNKVFSGKRFQLDSADSYRIIKRLNRFPKNSHLITVSSRFAHDNYIVLEYWIKHNNRCPGVIFSLFFENEEVIEHQKTLPCE